MNHNVHTRTKPGRSADDAQSFEGTAALALP